MVFGSAENIFDSEVLSKLSIYELIHRLKNSRVIFIPSPSEHRLVSLEYPLSIDIYALLRL